MARWRAAVKYPVGIDPEQFEDLPKKVIRYVGRTYEEVIIEAKPVGGPFAGDDHIKKHAGYLNHLPAVEVQ
jgi:hypothetical protein